MAVLIAAAGSGSRAQLPYPKTLFPIEGRPILLHILDAFASVDRKPTVVVSPTGRSEIARVLSSFGSEAFLVEQKAPNGMGDAVLQFRQSPAFSRAKNVALIWGDIPFLQPATISETIRTHIERGLDFTFPTRAVANPYTFVLRSKDGEVREVVESRERGGTPISRGEREIGFFVFKADVVLPILAEGLPGKYGETTGEHGFLYVIRHLVDRGYRVRGLPIADERDLISLNYRSDIDRRWAEDKK